MTPERWEHLYRLLKEALGLPYPQQGPYIEKACDQDSDLLEKARFLLQKVKGACPPFLAGQHRFEEAEPRLLRGYQTLLDALGDRSAKTKKALQCLIDLYEAWDKPDRAAHYRALATQAENSKND